MLRDVGFICPTLAFAAVAPATFVYHYTYVSASNPFGLGATHGAGLAFAATDDPGWAAFGEQDEIMLLDNSSSRPPRSAAAAAPRSPGSCPERPSGARRPSMATG